MSTRLPTLEFLASRFSLAGRCAVVTGAGSGLGQRAALVFAQAGATVALVGRRPEPLAETAALIRDAGGQSIECPLDVTDASAVDALLQRLRQNAEPLWVLLNNAGVAGRKPLFEVTPKDFDRVLEVNTRAAFFVAQAFARALVAQGSGGRIINMCSLSAERTPAGIGIYGTSKAALQHLTQCMANEWAAHGINVNAINPGYIETDLNRAMLQAPAGREMVRKLPRQRVAIPEALDGALLLLASPHGEYMTGATLRVDDAQAFAI